MVTFKRWWGKLYYTQYTFIDNNLLIVDTIYQKKKKLLILQGSMLWVVT